MAVTITANPRDIQTSKRPVVFTVTSNRDLANAFTSVSVDDDGGKCRYTKASHTILSGDIILPSGFSAAGINVVQTVTGVTATTFTTDLAYIVPGTTGTVTRYNLDFVIKCDVYVDGEVVGSIIQRAVSDAYSFDISKIIDSVYSSKDFLAWSGSPTIVNTRLNSYLEYSCIFTEYFNTALGVRTAGSTVTSSSYYVIKAVLEHTSVAGFETRHSMDTTCLNKYFLTNMPLAASISDVANMPIVSRQTGSLLGISFYSALTDITYWIRTWSAAIVMKDNWTADVTLAARNNTLYIDLDSVHADAVYIEIYIAKKTTSDYSKVIYLKIVNNTDYRYFYTIEFQNSLGAYDRFNFTKEYVLLSENESKSYDSKLATGFAYSDRGTNVFDVKENRRFSVKSEFISKETALWLLELKNSKDVYLWDYTLKDRIPLHDIVMDIPIDYNSDRLIQATFEASLPKNY